MMLETIYGLITFGFVLQSLKELKDCKKYNTITNIIVRVFAIVLCSILFPVYIGIYLHKIIMEKID